MKKQPLLLEVPKSSPSRRERLEAFKAANGIEVCYLNGVECPFTAVHMPSAKAMKAELGDAFEDELGEYIWHYGSRLEDVGIVVNGNSEIWVVRELCSNLEIPCPL